MQYWVIENILYKLPISSGAYAYNKGNSIKKHALVHSKSKHILRLDIKNFFPSISSELLYNILIEHKEIIENMNIYFSDAFDNIKKICFRYDKLCIGTVSSPIISNIIMYEFDLKIMSFCKSNKYTSSP